MKIVLLGYMGSGKSTIGKLVAEKLEYRFVDLDEYIEESEHLSISEIFGEKGEVYFRKKEAFYVSKILSENDELVLSLGGGTPCYANNMENIMKLTNKVFYLKVSASALTKRLLKEKSERPLIKNIEDDDLSEFIGKHLFERSQFYQKANFTIDCTAKEPEVAASEVKEILV